jgi:hypothetical protein
MALPQHTRHLVERLLGRYCERLCPPVFERQVRLDFCVDGNVAVLQELKPVFGIASMLRRVDVARFRYRPREGAWRLDFRPMPGSRWQAYPGGASRAFVRLLAEVDADPRGLFWGRVNGASLRWCSTRGRCAECERRYRTVLDLPAREAGSAGRASTAG